MKMYNMVGLCKLCNNNINSKSHIGVISRYFSVKSEELKTELGTAYKPHEIETTEYNAEYFKSPIQSDQVPYTMVLPPPNITGTLHLGHALTASIQDVLVKTNQMKGRPTMWLPGLDHAGIATQVVVEKKLLKERGLSRHQLGRDNFEKEVWKWKKEKSTTIPHQLQRLNTSLNWDKEAFTMDKVSSKAVTEAFIRLFDQGLIYRADHLVNWSCALQSAISDIEVDHVQLDGPTDIAVPGYDKPVKFGVLTRFAYKLADCEDEVIVATTRPETMLGDVAVAVNPKDSRYSQLVGRYLCHPFRSENIPIIADDFVDPEFGTGILFLTLNVKLSILKMKSYNFKNRTANRSQRGDALARGHLILKVVRLEDEQAVRCLVIQGAVKVTPAHDPIDFEAGKRHNLKPLSVINEQGLLTENCGQFKEIKRFLARESVLKELARMQLLRGTDGHKMIVPICSRSKDVIEFLIRPQWFLNCTQMAERAVADVREGRLKIHPEVFEKNWYHWLENIRDWCISRQLWWGHRIPAYSCKNRYLPDSEALWVAAENQETASIKASKLLNLDKSDIECIPDEDVLDTWFSSALQPFSVFGWPAKTDDLEKYYPLSIMETGHDILFFWVARMVMLGTHLTGQLPFDEILLHGIICDSHGRKMSKSLGNVIAPEEIIDGATSDDLKAQLQNSFRSGILSKEELAKAAQGQQKMFSHGIPECGADALRFTLLSHNVMTHIINFDVNECHTNRLFGNKIWQATKFTLLWINKVSELQPEDVFKADVDLTKADPIDKWILSRLSYMLQTVSDAVDKYEFHVATAALKNFLYYEYCDVYLEAIKTNLKEKPTDEVSKTHCWTLLTCLDCSLRALAPFMPVLAQHLHKHLPNLWDVGVSRSFPELLDLRNEPIEEEVEEVNEIVTSIRRLKKIFNVTFKYSPEAFLVPYNQTTARKFTQTIKDLSHLQTLHVLQPNWKKPQQAGLVEDSAGKTKIFLVVPEELKKNLELDREKMAMKKEKLTRELEKINNMINGSSYREKASVEAQKGHAKKVAQITEKLTRIRYIESLTH